MAKYVASIDQGTTSTRCILFDNDGNIVSADQKEHQQIYPRPGWVEHNALEIWERTQHVVRGALDKSGADVTDIAAIGITNQRETAWSGSAQPDARSIMPSYGRTRARMPFAMNWPKMADRTVSEPEPVCRWQLISPGRRSSGSWTMFPERANAPKKVI